jgi:hypothetical protein
MILIPDGLDLLISGINNLRVKSEDPAIGRVCLVMLTVLIIWDGGKLVCQLLKRIMSFGWCGLGGFWGFEGLDRKTGGGEQRTERARAGIMGEKGWAV